MPRLREFAAHIAVNSRRLPTFASLANLGQKTVICWVPAESGQIFTVQWWCTSNNLVWTTCGDVTIDGLGVGGMILSTDPQGHTHRGFSINSEMKVAPSTDTPFTFGNSDLPIESPDGGEVRLDIYRIFETTQDDSGSAEASLDNLPQKYPHDARLNRIDRLVTFIFKYRSETILRESGLKSHPRSRTIKKSRIRSQSHRALEAQNAAMRNVEEVIGVSQQPVDEPMNIDASAPPSNSMVLRSSRKRKRGDTAELNEDELKEELLWTEINKAKTHLEELLSQVQPFDKKRPLKRKKKRSKVAPGEKFSERQQYSNANALVPVAEMMITDAPEETAVKLENGQTDDLEL